MAKKKIGNLEREMLQQLTAGDLFIGMLLSGRSTKTMFATARARAARRQAMQRAVSRLSDKGFVEIDNDTLRLTKTGRAALESVVANLRIGARDTHKKWDGRWRLIAFDVPEKVRGARDALRAVLKRAGFFQLQQSMWVYPHDCEELHQLLAEDRRLEHAVVYAHVSHMNDEGRLLRHFKLTRKTNHV